MTKQTDDARGELLAKEQFLCAEADKAYFKAGNTSDPQHWLEAALLARQHRNALTALRAAPARCDAGSVEARSHWAIEASIPEDGFECYYLLRDDITVAEICGHQTEQRGRHLDDLVFAANGNTPERKILASQAMEYARRLNDIALNCEIAAFEGEGDASDLRRIAEWLAALVPPPSEAGREGIYIASKTRHAARWRAMREAGAPIISTWIDEAGEGEIADLHDLWDRCLSESKSCQSLIVYREPQDVLKGAWVEIGAALAVGVPVYAVGLDGFTISKYRSIKHFATIDEAFAAALSPDPGTVAAASVEVKTP
jgi:hypothetical protein